MIYSRTRNTLVCILYMYLPVLFTQQSYNDFNFILWLFFCSYMLYMYVCFFVCDGYTLQPFSEPNSTVYTTTAPKGLVYNVVYTRSPLVVLLYTV